LPTSLFSPFPIQKPRRDAVRLPERSPPRCCAKRRPDGQLLYRAVTVHHLTVMRRTEEQLRHAQRMESLGPLAGGLSHEVNNMMTVVLGFADLLVQAQALSDEHRTDVRQIVDAGQPDQPAAPGLRPPAAAQAGAGDVNALVRRVVALLRPLMAAVTIRTQLGDLDEHGVFADAGRLEQALSLPTISDSSCRGAARCSPPQTGHRTRARDRLRHREAERGAHLGGQQSGPRYHPQSLCGASSGHAFAAPIPICRSW
jgi:hypothetical protein